jgi:hypothetical protein
LPVFAGLASRLRKYHQFALKQRSLALAIILLGALGFPSLAAAQAPAVTQNPANLTVSLGGTAVFTAAATGVPSPTVQWQLSTDSGVSFGNITGATSTTLSFTAMAGQNGNLFRAVFTNTGGTATTTAATLTVAAGPILATNPVDVTVNAGATAVFTAAATGIPSPTVQWQLSTNGGGTFSNITGATSTTLSFTATVGQNGNLFRAMFTNTGGSATTTAATLTVTTGPVITTNPTDLTVNAGATAVFTAAATGATSPTVQWQVSTNGGGSFSNITGATSTTLSFTAMAGQNGNLFRAVFTNVGGSATTTAATMTVPSSSMTANAGTTPQSATVSTAFANPLAVTVKDAGNNPVSGVNVTFTAPAAGASGLFSNTSATMTVATNASGVASAPFSANATAGGPYAVVATATGLATVNFGLTNTAAKAAATVTVVSSLNPSAAGQTVTFTATVTGAAPTGSISFKDGATTLGTATLNGSGQATLPVSSLTAGSHSITAVYGGDAGNNGGTSAALTQTVNTAADSLKLRALQVTVTPMVAQNSGQAISDAVGSAISEGLSEGGTFIAPTGNGVRVNFAADADARAPSVAPPATDPFSSANGSFAEGSHGSGLHPSSSPRIDDVFGALAFVGATKAPPIRVTEPREWFGWAEVRGATLDRWGSSTAAAGASVLYGNQVNLLAGLTRKFAPNFLIGVLGGYETFDYRSDALQGRLKGDGWTVGSYLGWKITQNIRFDTAVAYSGIGYDGTAGMAAGSFRGDRWLVTGGLTGTYGSYGLQIEPSARVYALWEHENAYTDTLGTWQTARDFATGRASGGVKLSYPVAWSVTTVLAPYVGLYGDYYFNSDSAGAAAAAAVAIPSNLILDGWSARATGGLTAQFGNGALVAVGAERGGIGGSFGIWTYRARASMPFSAQ